VQRCFQALPEVADFAEMLSGDASPPVADPPFGGDHVLFDGAPLHVGKRRLDQVVFKQKLGALGALARR
jgi:hypothetical protein